MERRAKRLQILEHSVCLKPDQLTGYLDGTLFKEELRVVELHLASCQLCREALEGMENVDHRKALIEELSLPSLPVRKAIANPIVSVQKDIYNTKALKAIQPLPKSTFNPYSKHPVSHSRNLSWLGIAGIAVLLLLGGILFWQYQRSLPEWTSFAFDTGSSSKNLLLDSNRQESIPDTLHQKVARAHTTAPAPVKETGQAHDVTTTLPSSEEETAAAFQEQAKQESPPSATIAAKALPPLTEAGTPPKKEEKPIARLQKEETKAAPIPKKVSSPKEQPSAPALSNMTSAPAQPEDIAETAKPSDYTIGLRLYQKKQYASALLYLQTAAGDMHHPNHWDAVYYSALCNLEIGKSGRAKRLLKSIIKAGVPLSKKAEEQLEKM